uniref:Uncharacterized protein n=1 Tax=Strongyloides stercoralis TaxID=6248 RepID=A0A0K0E089_STRER
MDASLKGTEKCDSTGAESKTWKLFSVKRNFFGSNANYNRESRHYYCCFGGCCSTGTESEALKFLWRELKDVAILQLSLKHGCSFVRVGSCRSTGAESEA